MPMQTCEHARQESRHAPNLAGLAVGAVMQWPIQTCKQSRPEASHAAEGWYEGFQKLRRQDVAAEAAADGVERQLLIAGNHFTWRTRELPLWQFW